MQVWINLKEEDRLKAEEIEEKLGNLLKALDLPEAEVSISFVGDEEIKELNRQYRKKDAPTNVLSFCMQEGEGKDINPHLLGDIVLSLETAQWEAEACDFSLEEMVDFYLIHGLLHLLGYHHDHPEHENMMRKLWQVLGHLPYWDETS